MVILYKRTSIYRKLEKGTLRKGKKDAENKLQIKHEGHGKQILISTNQELRESSTL